MSNLWTRDSKFLARAANKFSLFEASSTISGWS